MTYEEKIIIMTNYMKYKVEEKDYHGVADCAMDLRDIENHKIGYDEGYKDATNLALTKIKDYEINSSNKFDICNIANIT